MSFSLAVDVMGGDVGAQVTVPAALDFLRVHDDCRLLLVGLPEAIEAQLSNASCSPDLRERLEIIPASQVVEMAESPQSALKNKKDSSMRVAINLVKEGRAQACVSAGNTGALMATARFVLKTLPGIDRPAIAKMMPSLSGGTTCMLDLGANVDCSAEHLAQFAFLGSALMSALQQQTRPSVALLNIGAEDIKGNEVVREAAELLRASDLNFVGNIEADAIYQAQVDVIVCDGFVGNVALKTSEGLASVIMRLLKDEFTANPMRKLSAVAAMPVLKALKSRLDPRRHNGASFLGLRGTVVKSHGGTDAFGFFCALEQAKIEVAHRVIEHMSAQIAAREATKISAI